MPTTFLNLRFLFILIVTIGYLPDGWSNLNLRTENYFYGRYFKLESVQLDPSNRLFNRPDYMMDADIRPELKLTYLDQKWIVRPRWTYSFKNIHFNDTNTNVTNSEGKIDLTDAYWESIFTDELRATVGLQVYQWGPAEFLNASNPIFHLNSQQRSTIFKEKGKVLARLNVDYTRNWNQVFIYEPISNRERPWIADNTEFKPKALVKTEWISDSGFNSVGFVFGREERSMGFFGEYFSYSPVEGFSIYLDSKHTEKSPAYYPEPNTYASESLVYNPKARSEWANFGVAGIRKEWSHLDLRCEYVYNSGGWSPEEFRDAKLTLIQQNPDTANNIARFASPGIELLGRAYGYVSFRFFNLGPKNNHSIALRYLYAEGDSSSTLTITHDWDFNDSINFFAEFYGSFGRKESELNLLQQQSGMLGLRWSM